VGSVLSALRGVFPRVAGTPASGTFFFASPDPSAASDVRHADPALESMHLTVEDFSPLYFHTVFGRTRPAAIKRSLERSPARQRQRDLRPR